MQLDAKTVSQPGLAPLLKRVFGNGEAEVFSGYYNDEGVVCGI